MLKWKDFSGNAEKKMTLNQSYFCIHLSDNAINSVYIDDSPNIFWKKPRRLVFCQD